MIVLAYPAHLPLWISETATEEARKQRPKARRAELQALAIEIADALFEALHLPNTAFN